MKRAKITQAPAAGASRSADLTDRLLGGSSPSKPRPKPKSPPKARRARAVPDAPAPAASDLPGYTPYRTAEPGTPVTPGPTLQSPSSVKLPGDAPPAIQAALADAEKAIASLISAAGDVPARHDLAVRYRLDALRHHLRQVSEFMATRRDLS